MTITWKPIAEYRYEMGTVLVWLAWGQYDISTRHFASTGDWMFAYAVAVRDVLVWLDANTGRPIEREGRTVTHFIQKEAPT